MSIFLGVAQYDFNMSFRRPGFWIAYILLGIFYTVSIVAPSLDVNESITTTEQIWAEAGHTIFMFNIFMPLLAGILSADRIQRDFQININELQRSTPLSIPAYTLAKFLGVLISVLAPVFIISLITGILMIIQNLAPAKILWPLFLAFLSIAVPAHAFVVAYSLVCPLVIPLRIYQVLFTGYWFWGNLISPKAFPTISDTLLNAVGQYPLQAYFSVMTDSTHDIAEAFTVTEAVLNLVVLSALIITVLIAANFSIRWQIDHS